MQTGATQLVSVTPTGYSGNGDSYYPFFTTDARYVVFLSGASDLVAGDANGQRDIFVRDMQTGTTSLVSVASDGTQANADGRYVSFQSFADNIVLDDTNNAFDSFVHDCSTLSTAESIQALMGRVAYLVSSGALNRGQGEALTVKLQGALSSIASSQYTSARNQMQAFINNVGALLNSHALTSPQANALIYSAQAIMERLP
jgi:hypothetical protein